MGEKGQNQIQHQHEYEHELKHELENEHEIENEGGIWQTPLIRSQATFQNIRFDFDSSSFSLLCLEFFFQAFDHFGKIFLPACSKIEVGCCGVWQANHMPSRRLCQMPCSAGEPEGEPEQPGP